MSFSSLVFTSAAAQQPLSLPGGEITTIEIHRSNPYIQLGISIVGGNETPLINIVIQEVYRDGIIARDGRLLAGDQILQVPFSPLLTCPLALIPEFKTQPCDASCSLNWIEVRCILFICTTDQDSSETSPTSLIHGMYFFLPTLTFHRTWALPSRSPGLASSRPPTHEEMLVSQVQFSHPSVPVQFIFLYCADC